VDFNFYGHQIVAHLAPGECRQVRLVLWTITSAGAPLRRGAINTRMGGPGEKLKAAGTKFEIEPTSASKAKRANRAPCSSWIVRNAVEIKGFATLDSLFAR